MAYIDAFLRLMLDQNASDLHLISGNEPVLRIDGDLVQVRYRTINPHECRMFLQEIMPVNLMTLFEQQMDVNFTYQLKQEARFRVNMFQHRGGLGASFRLVPMQIPSIEDLHLPMQLREFPMYRDGLVLVTGPSGSGKSTTLATLIDTINANSRRHILTIEDPIEFIFKRQQSLITQREVGLHTESFHAALQLATRSAADVLMVSELRDTKTIGMALTAAETGSLVFAAMHSRSCVSAISNLIDSFPFGQRPKIRSMLSVSLRGIITQGLARRPNYRGRIPVIELMSSSTDLSHMIREGNIHQLDTYFESADEARNIAWDRSLMELYTNEFITLDTAISIARNKQKFEALKV